MIDFRCVCLTVSLLAGVSCASDTAIVTPPPIKPDTAVTPSPSVLELRVDLSASEVAVGDSTKVYTYARFEGHTSFELTVASLTMRDTSIARLDTVAGFVHAGTRAGTTWLVGTRNGLRDSAIVIVWTPAFYLSPDTSAIPVGTTRTLAGRSFSTTKGGATVAATGWTSSNTAVATVDAQGRVTPLALGRTTISAATGATRATAEVIVTTFDHPHSFVSVKTGWGIACGIEADGTAYCWGSGFALTAPSAPSDRCESQSYYTVRTSSAFVRQMRRCALTPVKLPTPLRFQRAGSTVSGDVALLSLQGDLYVVGNQTLNPVLAGGPYKWGTIGGPTCGIMADDTGWCAGNNFAGVLGNGTAQGLGTDPTPRQPVGGLKWKELYAAHYNMCGLSTAGQAFCWGHNFGYLLGVGSGTGPVGDCPTQCVVVPTAVRTDVRFASLAVGDSDRCGIDGNGETWCWGQPPAGVDPLAPEAGPARIASAPRFVTLRGQKMCGLTADGAAYCLSRDGTATTMAARYSFVRVPLPFPAAQLEVTDLSPSCARSAADGAVYCWGDGGTLGDGTLNTATADKPARVAGQVP